MPEIETAPGLGGFHVRQQKPDGATESVELPTWPDVVRFVAERSRHDDYIPIGDIVARITKALGVKQCVPCAARQTVANRMLRKLW